MTNCWRSSRNFKGRSSGLCRDAGVRSPQNHRWQLALERACGHARHSSELGIAAQRMRAEMYQANSAAGSFDHLLDRHRRNRLIALSLATDEDPRIAGVWAFMLQIISQRLPSLYRQRQDVVTQRFRATQHHRAYMPVDVADHETGNFAGTEPQIQCTADDGVPALWPPPGGGKGLQQAISLIRSSAPNPYEEYPI